MKILPGPASIELSKKIAKNLNIPYLNLEYKQFTDGESYLQIDGEVNDEEIIIIQNTFPNQEKRLLEIMFLSATLKEYNASKVHVFTPYLCYARADRRRKEMEIISHKVTLELLYKSGVDSIMTFNVHNKEAFTSSVPELEKYDISVLPLIKKYLESETDDNYTIIGPDKGVSEELKYLSDGLDVSYTALEKYRDSVTHEISMRDIGIDVENKDVILFDDIITSGRTALDAFRIILDKRPKSLTFVVIHALAKPEVFVKMKEIGVHKIISTNTISRTDTEQIDVSSAISKFIEDKFL